MTIEYFKHMLFTKINIKWSYPDYYRTYIYMIKMSYICAI